ncbi:hypothetical protein AB8960_20185, partial [Yersinia enterocolitica]
VNIGSSKAAIFTQGGSVLHWHVGHFYIGTNINSQFRDINVNGSRLTGRVGYSANYAIYVHDPNVKQTFRRATAEKEFLVKGFEDTKHIIDKAIAEEMKL